MGLSAQQGAGGTHRVSSAPVTVSEASSARPGGRVLDLDLPVLPDSAGMPQLVLPASEPTRVSIPALDMTSRLMDLGLMRDGSMEVPPGAYPAGWYDRSPTPGELGPAVLAAHVDWAGQPGAFSGIDELVPGDEVVVDRADGTSAVFTVDRVEEHPKDEFPTDEVYGDIAHAGLRLITCGGAFDPESGDYLDNVVVFARLTDWSS
ncbi:sortase family protein [Geodermatophilus normandii]|uniref:Sortase family protein n=2 Tax=Geodermatophilus normandii TaxID=1137989 RepID=A0A317QKF2_9ACTN|nr:sortase family protein [Geodermatophilus normandii]